MNKPSTEVIVHLDARDCFQYLTFIGHEDISKRLSVLWQNKINMSLPVDIYFDALDEYNGDQQINLDLLFIKKVWNITSDHIVIDTKNLV